MARRLTLSRLFGSFGALIAIIALALGPFAQQIASYRVRTVENIEGAVIPRALNYTGALRGNSSSRCSEMTKIKSHNMQLATFRFYRLKLQYTMDYSRKTVAQRRHYH